MRLTLDLVRRAPQFINPLLQRELDLRGQRISSLDEHTLLLLEDSFDVVNLTSNALTSLEYFPITSKMVRVVTLVAHRNHLQKVSLPSCVLALPNVVHFLADHNNFRTAKNLCFLRYWRKLEVVSLEDNPVSRDNPEQLDEDMLRAFLVFLCPSLKLINNGRVVEADRKRAAAHKAHFKVIFSEWEASGSAAAVVGADGKKIRKRARERRVENQGATMDTVGQTPKSLHGAGGSPAREEDDDDNGGASRLQARLDQLEARISADDITAEEITSLEQEILEITVEQERRQRRRK